MAKSIEEMIEAALPGWTLVEDKPAVRTFRRNERVDLVTPSLEKARQKYASLVKPASEQEATPTFHDPPQNLTASVVVQRDGETLRVDYLLDGFKIIGMQG